MKAEIRPFMTIVMAVYNGENCLSRAIESILNNDSGDWELICVNDGSTDSSLEIIKSYAMNDERISVIDQANGGPGKARLAGYKVARGEYTFTGVDQDDFIASDFVTQFLESAGRSGADVILCDWLTEDSPGNFSSLLTRNGIELNSEFSGQKAFELTFPWEVHAVGLWKNDLVRQFAVDDDNVFNDYDSEEYLARLILLEAKKVVISGAKYFHCRNPDSITSGRSIKKIQSLDTNERLLSLADACSLENSAKWKILLYQRNYLANLIKMIYEMRYIDGLDIEVFNRSLKQIDKHFGRFKNEIRHRFRVDFSRALEVEKVIFKLEVRKFFARLPLYTASHRETGF